jgi:sialic acid synthase SpsE
MFKTAEELWKHLKSGKLYFIAEAGVNHVGDLSLANKLIEQAAIAGCDCIKFQSYKASELCTKDAPRFWNEKDFDGFTEEKKEGSQFDSYSLLDSFEAKEHKIMAQFCEDNKIDFMSTPFYNGAIEYLEEIGVIGHKIASCDITNFPLLEKVAKTNKVIFLSTGASYLKEVKDAVNIISKYNQKIVIMQCSLSYPSQPEEANLSMLKDLHNAFGEKYILGLSDHTTENITPAFSYCYGATVFERHFTIPEAKLKGKSPDNYFGATPENVKNIIYFLKMAEKMKGSTEKKPHSGELLARKNARRSIVASRNIRAGELFSLDNLTCKRPGTGISPVEMKSIIGKTAVIDIAEDKLLKHEHYKEI